MWAAEEAPQKYQDRFRYSPGDVYGDWVPWMRDSIHRFPWCVIYICTFAEPSLAATAGQLYYQRPS